METFGIGPIVAGMVIGFSGDPTRFATAARFASYTGRVPIEFSSGGRVTHGLSRRGNRRLNHALHIAAITQIRHPHSPGPPTTTASSPKARHHAKRYSP